MRDAIGSALNSFFKHDDTKMAAKAVFNSLGYDSPLTTNLESVEQLITFMNSADPKRPLTDRQRKMFEGWQSVDIVFQFSENELRTALNTSKEFSIDQEKSLMFIVVNAGNSKLTRTQLAETTRLINRLRMPTVILYRYEEKITLATVHRRPNKIEIGRDVLERVTLIKDIDLKSPHRAHIDILSEISLPKLIQSGCETFEELYDGWQKALNVEKLNRRFYSDLFRWFERALRETKISRSDKIIGLSERKIIRLITQILFVWFMKEKSLIPDELFSEEFAKNHLKNYDRQNSTYYSVVLENLFFATLNVEVQSRKFEIQQQSCLRNSDLLSKPSKFLDCLNAVPFVNGGLFEGSEMYDDCDDKKPQQGFTKSGGGG